MLARPAHCIVAFAVAACCCTPRAEVGVPPAPREGLARPSPTPTPAPPVRSVAKLPPARPSTPIQPSPSLHARPEIAGPVAQVFLPTDVAPLHPRTARPNDGKWRPVAEVDDGSHAPVLFRTTLHPHPIKKYVFVEIVAVDLERVALHLVPGTHEPTTDDVPAALRPGTVPLDDQPRLLAAFNGGFQTKHGRYGMAVGEHTFVPARDDACTIGLISDGTVRVGNWHSLDATRPHLLAFRQTPPCLVADGVPHTSLDSRDRRWRRRWGRSVKGEDEVRRSALGVSRDGKTLYYALGDWVTPRGMADALLAAGARAAAQLDINWSYTRFLFFAPDAGGALAVHATLIPELKHHPRHYVGKPSYRDFFYLARKPLATTASASGSAPAPPRSAPAR